MPNLLNIASNVSRNLDDLGASFYDTNADIIPSIQDGYNLVAALCESIENNVTLNFTSGTVFYNFKNLIPDFLRVFGIYNNNTNRWMWPTTMMELYRIRDNWELGAGDPYWFIPIDYANVAFFPTMPTGTGTFTVLYKATADVLMANSVPQLPLEQQKVLEWYATDDLLDQCEEWNKALMYANMLDKGIEDIKKVLRDRSSPNHLYFIQGNTI